MSQDWMSDPTTLMQVGLVTFDVLAFCWLEVMYLTR
jgi:hypothetical protein